MIYAQMWCTDGWVWRNLALSLSYNMSDMDEIITFHMRFNQFFFILYASLLCFSFRYAIRLLAVLYSERIKRFASFVVLYFVLYMTYSRQHTCFALYSCRRYHIFLFALFPSTFIVYTVHRSLQINDAIQRCPQYSMNIKQLMENFQNHGILIRYLVAALKWAQANHMRSQINAIFVSTQS